MSTENRCVICPVYGYEPAHWEQPYACHECRSRLARQLVSISDEWLALDATPGSGHSERVTGTHEQPIGARAAVLDQMLTAWNPNEPIRENISDQVGDAPASVVLDLIADEWREHRARAADDVTVSSDAMRWTPPDEEEPLNDVINRALDAAANESMDRVAHILATQPHTASAVHQAITQALNRERLLDTLTATVPDQADAYLDAYLDACDNDPRIALDYAQAGIPPATIPGLRANGITAAQAAISINTTDRSTT